MTQRPADDQLPPPTVQEPATPEDLQAQTISQADVDALQMQQLGDESRWPEQPQPEGTGQNIEVDHENTASRGPQGQQGEEADQEGDGPSW